MNKLKSCVYFFPNEYKLENESNNNYTNLLVDSSEKTKNSIQCINKLNKLTLFDKQFFYLPESIKKVNLGEIDEEHMRLNDATILPSNLVNYLFKFKKQQLIYFESYLKTLSGRNLIPQLSDCFCDLLWSLKELRYLNIIHGNICEDTLVFNMQTNCVAITNFETSYELKTVKDLCNLEKNVGCNYPLELHFLFYMQTNKWHSLSQHNIETIINDFASNSIINNFNKSVFDEFVSLSLKYFQKYVNKDKEYILNDIYRFRSTWDIYQLSFTFLKILIDINAELTNKRNKFIILFLKLLVYNLHFDPENRYSIDTTIYNYKKLLSEIDVDTYKDFIEHYKTNIDNFINS